MTTRETADRIAADAARWIWRLDREGRTPELEAELQSWLAGDSRREGAWLQAEATWMLLDRANQSAMAPVVARSSRRDVAIPRRAMLTGAGAAIAASVAGLAVWRFSGERYAAKLGEIRHVPLADGSTALINTQSAINVAMTPARRVVKLDRGEAWFQVAKNPQRPFVVEAGPVRVRAVGTAFSVQRHANGADILVTEGVVEAWSTAADGARIRLQAGASAFVADDAAVQERPAGPSEVDRRLAWREGKIDLAGETLAEAATEFNRYNSRKLVIADPRLAQQRFYGVFRTDDPEGFADAVHTSLGARVVASDDTVRID